MGCHVGQGVKTKEPAPGSTASCTDRPNPSLLEEEGLVVSQMGIITIVTTLKGTVYRLCRTNTVGYDSSYAVTHLLVCRASQLPR